MTDDRRQNEGDWPVPPGKLPDWEQETVRARARSACVVLVRATEPWQARVARERLGIEDS